MSTLVDVFENLVQQGWRLERKDAHWLIREANNTSNPSLSITGAKALGFSLEKQGEKPWPFLKALDGILSVCDGILVTQIEDRAYVLAIELKSGNTSKAGKQIGSTWLLMEWLFGLLRLNEHWAASWDFYGVISSTPRKQEPKGTTRREQSIHIGSRSNFGYKTVHLRNQRKLNLIDLDNALQRAV